MRLAVRCFLFFGGGPGLFELLCEVVDEDAADDVEGEAARGVDAGDGDVVVLVAEDGGVGDARDRTRPSTSRSTAWPEPERLSLI